jgi:hypothetical protein
LELSHVELFKLKANPDEIRRGRPVQGRKRRESIAFPFSLIEEFEMQRR